MLTLLSQSTADLLENCDMKPFCGRCRPSSKVRNVHPGTAKGQMVNALQLAIDFHSNSAGDRPELTDGTRFLPSHGYNW